MNRLLPPALACALALALSASAQAAPSPDLVVSQVYGGGGNSGATYTHDYIEIFNRGPSTVQLNGLSLQYASATGTGNFGSSATQLTELPTYELAPGRALLVQEAQGTGGTTPLPTPDHVDPTPIALAATAGKVALVTGTTSLGCNGSSTPCSQAARDRIRDLVGFGSANYSEGAPAPAPSNTTAVIRRDGGCTDTDDNAADFAALAPAPRNGRSPADPCGVGDAAPAVSSTTPGDGATDVDPDAPLSVTFTEPVDPRAGAFALTCDGDAVAIDVSGGPTTFALNPERPLADGAACTARVEADAISDQDAADPPDAPAEDESWSFIVSKGCAGAFTPIPEIQGSGTRSPLVGRSVTTQGVVVGDFQGSSNLAGFFVQDPAGDDDPETSDGVFVFSNTAVDLGDHVRLRGTVSEFRRSSAASEETLTQLTGVTLDACDEPAPMPSAATIDLPTERPLLERLEGMRIRTEDDLVATELFDLRFGEVLLSEGGTLVQPTEVMEPGAEAAAAGRANGDRTLLLDDGRSVTHPFPNPYTSAADALRRGDALVGEVAGVLHYDFGKFRVQPTRAPTFAERNPRPAGPPAVGGDVQVGSFNVLNYFLTFGRSEDRGAPNAGEFEQQQAKIVAAISGLGAEVVTLQEVQDTSDEESYGNDPDAALAALVEALNDEAGERRWAYVSAPPEPWRNTDEIRVGIIYQPAAVEPVGPQVQFADERFLEIARVPLAQTFRSATERFTVVANHFKSKGCADDSAEADRDQGDGQSCFNATRVRQAEAELEFVEQLRVATDDDDVLVLGDLNSYTREDPIRTLVEGGLVNLHERDLAPEDRYSYVFFGQQGVLDHVLSTRSLAEKVTGTGVWHINADESRVYEYGGTNGLYAPDPYRSSDHDADLVGIRHDTPTTCRGEVATIVGTSAGETLRGTNGDDVIVAFEGDDTIMAGNGDDTVCAGTGDDTVDGGNGHDVIAGGPGDDELRGGNGDDALEGGPGDDAVDGGRGADSESD